MFYSFANDFGSFKIWVFILMLSANHIYGQGEIDMIQFDNGDIIFVEIIGLEKNKLLIDAEYGHEKWEVKWNSVIGIKTGNTFQIGLLSGDNYYGRLESQDDSSILITRKENPPISCKLSDIVWLHQYEDKILSQISGSISLGLSQSKARNLLSLTSTGDIFYTPKKSMLNFYYNTLFSSQDETQDLFRYEVLVGYTYTLPKRYFAYASSYILSNTEQQLERRLNILAGMGSYIVENQKNKLSVLVGVNQNIEKFNNENSGDNSWEGLIQADFDLFNLSALKIKANALAFPGITQKGRWRADFKFNLKYDIKYLKKTNLTNKIFIQLGVSANYDNRPAQNANELDYVLSTTIGFSWNE